MVAMWVDSSIFLKLTKVTNIISMIAHSSLLQLVRALSLLLNYHTMNSMEVMLHTWDNWWTSIILGMSVIPLLVLLKLLTLALAKVLKSILWLIQSTQHHRHLTSCTTRYLEFLLKTSSIQLFPTPMVNSSLLSQLILDIWLLILKRCNTSIFLTPKIYILISACLKAVSIKQLHTHTHYQLLSAVQSTLITSSLYKEISLYQVVLFILKIKMLWICKIPSRTNWALVKMCNLMIVDLFLQTTLGGISTLWTTS